MDTGEGRFVSVSVLHVKNFQVEFPSVQSVI